jgi:hypothetical protein
MAEGLIYARNDPLTGDLTIDNARYKPGDFVVFKDDGWKWTAMESKAAWIAAGRPGQWSKTFILLKMKGIDTARLTSMLDVWESSPGILFRRRMRFLDISATPQQIRDKIGSDWEITVTPSQIRNFIKRKSDGAVFDPGFD